MPRDENLEHCRSSGGSSFFYGHFPPRVAYTVGKIGVPKGGKTVRVSELQERVVINILDGKRLGYISDVVIDPERGRITALVLPGEGRFFGLFGHGKEKVIPWSHIVKIGIDCVLVRFGDELDRPFSLASRGG